MKHAIRTLALVLLTTRGFAETPAPAAPPGIAERFGLEIAQALNERDRDTLSGLIDMHALAMRAADYQGLTGRDRQDFVRGTESVGVGKLTAAYFTALDASHGTVKFIRATKQFPPRSLVRFDMADHGFNYCEFVLATDSAGHTRAVDWFQLATGDLMSVTLGGVGQVLSTDNPGLVERLLGARPDASALEQLRRLGDLQRAGKYDEALDLVKHLPEPLVNSRVMLTTRASVAIYAKRTDEYYLALAQIAKRYSTDPAASFMLMDYYYKQHDIPQVLRALDTMEKRIGVDGITRQLRGNAYFLSNDLPNAIRYTEESIRLEPDRLEPHDQRATFLVHSARYADAVAEYRDIEQRFGLHFTRDIFVKDPEYAGLVKSNVFGAWLPDRPKAD